MSPTEIDPSLGFPRAAYRSAIETPEAAQLWPQFPRYRRDHPPDKRMDQLEPRFHYCGALAPLSKSASSCIRLFQPFAAAIASSDVRQRQIALATQEPRSGVCAVRADDLASARPSGRAILGDRTRCHWTFGKVLALVNPSTSTAYTYELGLSVYRRSNIPGRLPSLQCRLHRGKSPEEAARQAGMHDHRRRNQWQAPLRYH